MKSSRVTACFVAGAAVVFAVFALQGLASANVTYYLPGIDGGEVSKRTYVHLPDLIGGSLLAVASIAAFGAASLLWFDRSRGLRTALLVIAGILPIVAAVFLMQATPTF